MKTLIVEASGQPANYGYWRASSDIGNLVSNSVFTERKTGGNNTSGTKTWIEYAKISLLIFIDLPLVSVFTSTGKDSIWARLISLFSAISSTEGAVIRKSVPQIYLWRQHPQHERGDPFKPLTVFKLFSVEPVFVIFDESEIGEKVKLCLQGLIDNTIGLLNEFFFHHTLIEFEWPISRSKNARTNCPTARLKGLQGKPHFWYQRDSCRSEQWWSIDDF